MLNNYKEISLEGAWQLRGESIDAKVSEAKRISKLKRGWIETPVPGDVRQGLIDAGVVKEPTLGMNSYDDFFVEKKSWWLKTSFVVTKAMKSSDSLELYLDGLDANASIFINGRLIGEHPTAFRPFVKRINEDIVEGENTILVRLTHGIEDITQQSVDDVGGKVITEAINNNPNAGDRRRIYVRKPQYSWGWDWVPRIATAGITGGAMIKVCNQAVIRDMQITPEHGRKSKTKILNTALEIEWFHQTKAGSADILLSVVEPDGGVVSSTKKKNILLQRGLNYIDFSSEIKNAKLWWPNHMGQQNRYTVKAELLVDGRKVDKRSTKYGIRFVELDTDDKFALKINGHKIFCKGANWIPCDAIYGRVTDERVSSLVKEAQEAKFNMLRIWGGGLYEREAFYEACDKEGVLVWQDFMFACSPPPDHLESFKDEIRKEADYQTRRLHNHSCIALWCGSNECVWAMSSFEYGKTYNGAKIFGEILPKAVRNNCPELPYWFASPYGQGDNWLHGDSDAIGDCHFWTTAMMHPNMGKRISPELFDTECNCRFVSEYGFVGPCSEETTLQYLDGGEFDRSGQVWQHHCNGFEKGTVDAAIRRHYTDPSKITTSEYLYYGGLVQGLMYGYSLETMRSLSSCDGGLFWMYNDCWGEVGWTIIDYYLRRKISWYFVKRALADRRLILRKEKNDIAVYLANDTLKPTKGKLEYGYVSLDGKKTISECIDINAKPLSCSVLLKFKKGRHDKTKGLWFARILGKDDIGFAYLRSVDTCKLKLHEPAVKYSLKSKGDSKYVLNILSDVYAHAVRINLPTYAVAEDNYFDLLPDIQRSIVIDSRKKLEESDITIDTCSLNF